MQWIRPLLTGQKAQGLPGPEDGDQLPQLDLQRESRRLKHPHSALPAIVPDLAQLLHRVDISPRLLAHETLHQLLREQATDEELATYVLGEVDTFANYCAQKEREKIGTLGQKIMEVNELWDQRVAGFTRQLLHIDVPLLYRRVEEEDIGHLKIALASEMAMILRPNIHCVLNKRTLFCFYRSQGKHPEFSDEELFEQIMQDHGQWGVSYHKAVAFFDTLYQKALQRHFPQQSYKYFYVENFLSHLYEWARQERKAFSFEKFSRLYLKS